VNQQVIDEAEREGNAHLGWFNQTGKKQSKKYIHDEYINKINKEW
jgi:hypothetical protein